MNYPVTTFTTAANKLPERLLLQTVHEMARDEARHGRGLEGLLKRYFK